MTMSKKLVVLIYTALVNETCISLDSGGGTILKVGGPVLEKVDDQWW